MTPANVVTIVRVCLVPVFFIFLICPWRDWLSLEGFTYALQSLIAAILFILIACTDFLDGYLARKRNEVSDFGKIFDPIADKILVAAALLALVEVGTIPSWPVLIILAREFVVAGFRMMTARRGEVIAASWFGKSKTVAQMITIVLFLVLDSLPLFTSSTGVENFFFVFSWVVMAIALVLTVISMIDYIVKACRVIAKEISDPDDASAASRDVKGRHAAVGAASDAGVEERLENYDDVYALAADVINRASAAKMLIATAESLTGGMISSALTSVPGSSAVVRGGIVSYVNGVKSDLLGVDPALLKAQGAVNEQTACEMAKGAQSSLEADMCVAVTGIAGPSGAEEGKPVGTVWIALASDAGLDAHECHFEGGRQEVREQTVAYALSLLDEALKELTS